MMPNKLDVLWWLKARRRKPLAHMRSGFGLAGSAQKRFSFSAGWKRPGRLAQALRFFGKTIFKGLGLFETATQHDTISSAYGS